MKETEKEDGTNSQEKDTEKEQEEQANIVQDKPETVEELRGAPNYR